MFDALISIVPSTTVLVIGVGVVVFLLGTGLSRDTRLDERAEALKEHRRHAAPRKQEGPSARERAQALTSAFVIRVLALLGLHQKFDDMLDRAGIRSPYAQLYFSVAKFAGFFVMSGLLYLNYRASFQLVLNPARSYTIIFVAGGMAFFLPDLLVKNRIVKRQQEVRRHWQDALDLLIICVESGLSIEQAMRRVTQEIANVAPVIAEELVITLTELSLLPERRQAYANLGARIDLPSVKSTTVALIQAERQGAAIGKSLRMISIANREDLINAAEQKAASLGPKLTVPMIVFFLPVLFVIIISPMFLNSSL